MVRKRIIDFVLKEMPHYKRKDIGNMIDIHMKYGTLDFAEDNNGTLKSKEINSNQNNKTNGLGLKIFL